MKSYLRYFHFFGQPVLVSLYQLLTRSVV